MDLWDPRGTKVIPSSSFYFDFPDGVLEEDTDQLAFSRSQVYSSVLLWLLDGFPT